MNIFGPFHIISYGTLLGASIYQSFVNGIVAYRILPRAQFASLQTALTPVYFAIQTALPVIMALTFPSTRHDSSHTRPGIAGLLDRRNYWNALAPIGCMFVTAAANLTILGPRTTAIMKQRKHQETRDGKKYHDPGPHSVDMQQLNAAFSRWHGANAIVNLFGIGAMVWYGVLLADRFQ